MKEYTRIMPIVALRNMAVLPGMLVHFDVNRKKSIAAIEQAMHDDQMIFLVAQKDMRIDEPTVDDLYQVGCISQVKQIIKLPGGLIRVMIVGTKQQSVLEFTILSDREEKAFDQV